MIGPDSSAFKDISNQQRPDCPRDLLVAVVVCAVALILSVAAPTGVLYAQTSSGPPWEVWTDLYRLAEVDPGHQIALRSSHCLDGCRFDRHSDGDPRYLRLDGDEGVIFEESGPGAITRIWMTTGSMGVSTPLDPSVRIRFYFDGEATPTLDLPLPALFDGSNPPFVSPLAADRLDSSGGNVSYVPMPYRQGCRVTLEGADAKRLWFQFTHHRLAGADGVETFTGTEDLTGFADLLASAGSDPWPDEKPDSGTTVTGTVQLEPQQQVSIASFVGPDTLTALRLDAAPEHRDEIELVAVFDGEETARLSLAEFFADGAQGATRSLLVGEDAAGWLYSYFPMPVHSTAELRLRRLAASDLDQGASHRSAGSVDVSYEVRASGEPPRPNSGLFAVQIHHHDPSTIGLDLPLLQADGAGKWVGLFAELSSVGSSSREYLEGDERVFLDGSFHPSIYGTGTEDLFNGGFYFDQGPITSALHGAPYHLPPSEPGGVDTTAMYRLFLTDGVVFARRIRAGLEGGPTGNLAVRGTTVAYLYRQGPAKLARRDVLDLGDPASRAAHGYETDAPTTPVTLTALFEGEPARGLNDRGLTRGSGAARFVLESETGSTRYRLRRRLDAGIRWQQAEVWIGEPGTGNLAGVFAPIGANPHRRWQEVDLDLPPSLVDGLDQIPITIVATQLPNEAAPTEPPPTDVTRSGTDLFTAFRYELWVDAPCAACDDVFSDGFETGDLDAWSRRVPL